MEKENNRRAKSLCADAKHAKRPRYSSTREAERPVPCAHGLKDDTFDGLLDKIEAKYDAKIMTLFGDHAEEKVDDFSEEWFFGHCFSSSPFIMIETAIADEISLETHKMKECCRYDVGMVADSTDFELSPNGYDGTKTRVQIARTAMATMIALMFDMCCMGERCEEEGEEAREDNLRGMEDNWKAVLKHSDEDLGILKGTRGGVLHLIKMWTDFYKGDITCRSDLMGSE